MAIMAAATRPAMIAIVPGYISRSVAGSYDNEGIAIFCMLLTYFLWIKAVKTGSLYWSTFCALAYFYMVSLCVCVSVCLSVCLSVHVCMLPPLFTHGCRSPLGVGMYS